MLQWLQYPKILLHTVFLFGIVALERPMGGSAAVVLSLVTSGRCLWTGGVLFPGGVSGSDGGGSDAHSAGFGQS